MTRITILLLTAFLSTAYGQGGSIISAGPGAAVTPPAAKVPPEQRCTLSGTVTNALTGEPVKKANVRLTADQTASFEGGRPSVQGYAATSEADGTFRIEGIEPGTYTLTGMRTGFLQSNYGAKGPNQLGTKITLSPAQNLSGAALALTPQAVMSGKVLDEDGEPAANTQVQVLAPTWMRGKKRMMPRQSSNTNDLGEFRLANLSPGKYFLSAQQHHPMMFGQPEPAPPANGKADIRPVTTFYPGVTDLESATALEIKAGQDLPGMEIRLHTAQTFHVRGHVVGAAVEEGRSRGMVMTRPRGSFGFSFSGTQSPIKPDSSFDIAGLPSGSYTLSLMIMGGNVRSGGQQSVDVGSSDVNDVTISTAAPFFVRGVIRVEGTPPTGTTPVDFSRVRPFLSPADFGMWSSPGQPKIEKDGSFSIENVAAGLYSVNVAPPAGTYVKSILNGQTEVKGSDLDLTGGTTSDLQIVLRYGVSEVTGALQSSRGANGAAVTGQILFVPEPMNPDNSGLRMTSTNGSGSFDMKQIPPGRYRVVALAEYNYSQSQDPELLSRLAGKGIDLELGENERKQITVPLVSAEEAIRLGAGANAQ